MASAYYYGGSSADLGGHAPPAAVAGASLQAQDQVRRRLDQATQKRHELLGTLDVLTDGLYADHERNGLSAAHKAGLDEVDWRVPRLMYCKDPKHNAGVNPAFAYEVQQRKLADSEVIEKQLGREATDNWAQALQVVGQKPPPLEMNRRRPTPFVEAEPDYSAVDDVWARTLELRTLDEAMRGDVSKPLPRPAVHTEEYTNFHEGRYVKDDCPIA